MSICIVKSVSEVLGKLLDSRKSYIASSRGQGNAVPKIKYAKKHLLS